MALVDQSLTFGDVTSSDYNIYISGEGVFNAPKRRTKVVEIPGRNGDLAQDLGSYENINVTYPAFYKAPDLATFADDLEAFRAAIASKIGYQRLTDTIHPDQYRMGLFIEGLTITPVEYNTLGKFDLVFNCMPQRWLRSGETKKTVAASSTQTNNTHFAAEPLFEVLGYGDISITPTGQAAQVISVTNNPIGSVAMRQAVNHTFPATEGIKTGTYTLQNYEALNTGDNIINDPITFTYDINTNGATITAVNITDESGTGTVSVTTANSTATVTVTIPSFNYTKGTASRVQKQFTLSVRFNPAGQSWSQEVTVAAAYTNSDRITYNMTGGVNDGRITVTPAWSIGAVSGYSTMTVSDPLYIDCSTGVAWYVIGGETVSANNIVAFPIELPVLAPGANALVFSNTFTSRKITPRWWTL